MREAHRVTLCGESRGSRSCRAYYLESKNEEVSCIRPSTRKIDAATRVYVQTVLANAPNAPMPSKRQSKSGRVSRTLMLQDGGGVPRVNLPHKTKKARDVSAGVRSITPRVAFPR